MMSNTSGQNLAVSPTDSDINNFGCVSPYSIVDNDVIVIKIGSNSLLGADGKSLDEEYMKKIADQVSVLMKDHGKKVVLVSSGACAVGVQTMGMSQKPESVEECQALSAIGQIHVITKWERAFAPHKLLCSQLMLTHHDFNIRSSSKNLIATLRVLFEWGIVPIVNENDPIATSELTVGDNDRLAALLSSQVAAKHLLLLTDINGLYDADPRFNPEAKKLDVVEAVTKTMLNAAGGPGAKGRGGMRSKLESARFAAACGVCAIIAHSREEQVVLRTILDDNAQIGTKILPVPWDQPADDAVNERRRWIACKRTTGVVTVDQAGEDNFMARGDINTDHIVDHEGTFGVGDTVEVRDASGHEIGRAVTSVSNTSFNDHANEVAIGCDDLAILEPPRPNTTH